VRAAAHIGAEPLEIRTFPGVYVPDLDSRMLMNAFVERGPEPRAFVLDACCGCGIQGIAAARAGHRVVSVDSEAVAVRATRMNALLNDVDLEICRGDLFDPVDGWRFDAVLVNPPYVPTPPRSRPTAWADGGGDGRAVIDRVCSGVERVLARHGKLWMVQSSLANIPLSLEMLELSGFSAQVVASELLELGPVSRAREGYLTDAGFLDARAEVEQLVVIEASLEL
jgi:release factor glutamine methyltransferase